MTDDDPSPPERPPPTRPSKEWLAEQRVKSAAYEATRARYTGAWHRRLAGLKDEPEPKEEMADPTHGPERGKRRSRARGKIHNPRQHSLNFDG
jgi:hypothetical protein